MELWCSQRMGELERECTIIFDASSAADCAQAALHASRFFSGKYGEEPKSTLLGISPDEIKAAVERAAKRVVTPGQV